MIPSELRKRVRELIEPSIRRLGFDLVAVEWLGATRGPILRISIDHPKGIRARDCAEVTHYISPVLDEADPVDNAYTLEVSSPGIDRPVERLDDYRRFLGKRIRVRLEEGHPRRRFSGMLVGVDDDEVLVEVDGQVHRLRHDTIERAHLVLELKEYEKLAEVLHDAE